MIITPCPFDGDPKVELVQPDDDDLVLASFSDRIDHLMVIRAAREVFRLLIQRGFTVSAANARINSFIDRIVIRAVQTNAK